jgi:hypothetical protein
MSYRSRTTKTLLVDATGEAARSAVIDTMDGWVHSSWRETSGGYEFWLLGDQLNGESGRFRIQSAAGGSRTSITLELESHGDFGGRAEAIVNKLGLARQASFMLRQIRARANGGPGHEQALGA